MGPWDPVPCPLGDGDGHGGDSVPAHRWEDTAFLAWTPGTENSRAPRVEAHGGPEAGQPEPQSRGGGGRGFSSGSWPPFPPLASAWGHFRRQTQCKHIETIDGFFLVAVYHLHTRTHFPTAISQIIHNSNQGFRIFTRVSVWFYLRHLPEYN